MVSVISRYVSREVIRGRHGVGNIVLMNEVMLAAGKSLIADSTGLLDQRHLIGRSYLLRTAGFRTAAVCGMMLDQVPSSRQREIVDRSR